MNPAALLQRQAHRRRDALWVLEDLDVIARWADLGEAVLCGAVAHSLVVAPDIDVEIVGDPDVRRGFALIAEWASRPSVNRVLFLDELGGPGGGLGWQLNYRYGGQDWTVQMWLLPPGYAGPRAVDLVEPLRRALTPSSRAAILAIKEALAARRHNGISLDVYRAVVDDGIRDIVGFDNWPGLRTAPGDLVRWQPAGATG
ncbi:MAG: hypothetical protein ACRCYX_00565 [Dermatophilaceae bacterium]